MTWEQVWRDLQPLFWMCVAIAGLRFIWWLFERLACDHEWSESVSGFWAEEPGGPREAHLIHWDCRLCSKHLGDEPDLFPYAEGETREQGQQRAALAVAGVVGSLPLQLYVPRHPSDQEPEPPVATSGYIAPISEVESFRMHQLRLAQGPGQWRDVWKRVEQEDKDKGQ